jgi:hypothetical protein
MLELNVLELMILVYFFVKIIYKVKLQRNTNIHEHRLL